ncbi:MAG: alpha/beta hydrolase family protein [Acidimicrobiales bacterium]
MPDAGIEAAVSHWAPRFVTQGVDHSDFQRITSKLDSWENWLDAWCANGDLHTSLAEQAAALGRNRTAGEAYVRAALSYHFAKFVWVLDMDKHRQATDRSVASLLQAHRLLDPSAERVEIPFENATLVGNLRRPVGEARPPLVILLPGLDSTKEEFFNWEQVFIDRGLATFSLDGPGQGETGYELALRHDYEVPMSAVIDHLSERSDLDIERLGVAGVSLGGYYAPRAAAFEPRIRAVVAVAGAYDMGPRFDDRPVISRQAFQQYSHSADFDEAKTKAMSICLKGVAELIEQPMLVVTGKLDRLVPWEETRKIAEEARNAEFVVYDDGNHVCNNLAYLYRPLASDWIGEQLRAL